MNRSVCAGVVQLQMRSRVASGCVNPRQFGCVVIVLNFDAAGGSIQLVFGFWCGGFLFERDVNAHRIGTTDHGSRTACIGFRTALATGFRTGLPIGFRTGLTIGLRTGLRFSFDSGASASGRWDRQRADDGRIDDTLQFGYYFAGWFRPVEEFAGLEILRHLLVRHDHVECVPTSAFQLSSNQLINK